MDRLEEFCDLIEATKLQKIECAIAFIWFHSKITDEGECSIKMINDYFAMASLPKANPTYLKRDLQKSRKVGRGDKFSTYKLLRGTRSEYDNSYGHLFTIEKAEVEIGVNLNETPLITPEDIVSAKKMAELYVIIHCYENSARRLIERKLSTELGDDWWEQASNSGMLKKYNERKSKEEKNKWLSPRGNNSSPLYYLDWADLVTLIRKYQTEFGSIIHDIKFVELRLEELEKTRNIVAHNGILPSQDDFQRVILSFKDWCKQVADA